MAIQSLSCNVCLLLYVICCPLLKTRLPGGLTSAHTHPVYSARVVGTQNAHNLITIRNAEQKCNVRLVS